MDNIINHSAGTIIINGGNALPGCPESYDQASEWEDTANKNKHEDYEPRWSFDCGYKLDFDGPILQISSRFYPPKTHYGPKWDGSVSLFFMGDEISEKKFEENTLDDLRASVEKYVDSICRKIKTNYEQRR